MNTQKNFAPVCPLPISDYPQVMMAHGGGGRLMNQLIEKMIIPAFRNERLEARHDGAILHLEGTRIAFTTDSYVVKPLFFPGGDIGRLAINGTVNDLAMCGARPLFLSAGLVIEEGLSMETLWQVLNSMSVAAREAQVILVTGDTKVVDKGKGDGIYINTSGIGAIEHNLVVGPSNVGPGDKVILSGDIGRHGMAIMAAREGIEFESQIESDCAPLSSLVNLLINAGINIHCMRDLTRGGLASALIEIAETAGVNIHLVEARIPVREDVQAACEILGFDPLYVANEGRFISFVPPSQAEDALRTLLSHPLGENASIIGEVTDDPRGMVTITSAIGATRIVDMLSGEQLPRIC